MQGISKRFGTRENSSPFKMIAVVRVLKREEGEIIKNTYTTAAVDITAWTKTGQKIFESFHMISVPDKRFYSYLALRMQIGQLLRSDLRGLVQALELNN